MEAKQKSNSRFRILDLTRGVAVLAMILAHSVYFLYGGANPFVHGLESFGNTLCYTLFLLVSGATFYIAYFRDEDEWHSKVIRLKRRILAVAASYYVLALLVSFEAFLRANGLEKITLFLNILFLREMPSYTEFLPPFFIYPFLFFVFASFLRKIIKNNYLVLFLAIGLYALGALLYKVEVFEFLTPTKALISGSEGYFRFPILAYAPVYLLGIAWGRMMARVNNLKNKREISYHLTLLFSGSFVVILFAYLASSGDTASFLLRWPPSVPFILLGILISFIFISLFYKLKLLKEFDATRDFLLVLGQNALGFVVAHVLLLSTYSLVGGVKTDMIFVFILGFIFVLLISTALTAIIPFNFRLSLTLHRHGHHEESLLESPILELEEDIGKDIKKEVTLIEKFFFIGRFNKGKDKELIRKRHVLGGVLLASLASFVILPPISEQITIFENDKVTKDWFSEEYAFRQEFKIENNQALSGINSGEVVEYSFNHKDLVESGKSNKDGSDIVLLYWDGSDYKVVEYALTNGFERADTLISFKIIDEISPVSKSRPYFLYYGNPTAEGEPIKSNNTPIKISYYRIINEKEENFGLLLNLDRKWVLLDNPKGEPNLKATLRGEGSSENEVKIEILGTSVEGKLTKTETGVWEGTLDVSDLEPGKYYAKAIRKNGLGEESSQKVGFYVSYPLFVTWTIDWEGYSPSDANLANLESLSEKYSAPMTHLFNPRIYATDSISGTRAKYLTNWVKRRDGKGDAIGMHLHMFYDFVKSAGVKAKKSPNWGDSGDGYGSLTTNYNEVEMLNIINYGLKLFKDNGLPAPKVYRAGGWFANLNTLKALSEAGIKADSSGRTSYYFYETKGPWNLTENAQPYYPSSLNQNSSNPPRLNILEIPNNGADSYWFSERELLERFENLYDKNEKILIEKKQLTYLSHPDWFTSREKAKIEPTIEEINFYNYKLDNGPIIFVTLDEVYEAWK